VGTWSPVVFPVVFPLKDCFCFYLDVFTENSLLHVSNPLHFSTAKK